MPRAVEGIPVGRKADVLFFLHTFHHTKEWRPASDEQKQAKPASAGSRSAADRWPAASGSAPR